MTTSVNLARFYLQNAATLPMHVWVMDGDMPYPTWPDADMVFVVHPPPLDIPVLAEVWKQGRKLVLVSTKLDQRLTSPGHPLSEFFALPTAGRVLTHLQQRQATVFFLSFQPRRPWYLNWLPQKEHDAFVEDGPHWVFRFEEYVPYEGSFEFDDAYRRSSLQECTFAQSTNHFLHVLETLPATALADSQMKRSVFQGVFPFYTGQRLSPDVPFDWRSSLAPVRQAVMGGDLQTQTATYALALACLSEVGAAFTHRGRHDLYHTLMGDLVRLQHSRVVVGTFTPAQVQRLRDMHPFLYLHVFYRVPNQFLVAMVDAVRDTLRHTEIMAAAEDLLTRLVTHEEDLHYVKRTYELTALSGTLCQLKTFAARYHNDRPRLLAAKEDGLCAVHHARADDLSRDLNYWMLAVLTDWVRFPTQVQADAAAADAEYAYIVESLRGHLQHEPESYYNLMVVYLAAAVEAVCRPETRICDLLRAHGIGPQTLTTLFQGADYDERRVGTYALCLAAGYAALLAPTMGWSADSLAVPLDRAYHFFFTRPDQHGGQAGVILRIIALKYAACRLFFLQTRHDAAGIAAEADAYLTHLQALAPHLGTHAALTGFFADAKAQPASLDVSEVLCVVFTLPY
jgi:hypothetical protein